IEREIQAEELREMMKDSSKLNSIGGSLSEAGQVLDEFKRDVESADRDLTDELEEGSPEADTTPRSTIDQAATDVGKSVSGGAADPPAGDDPVKDAARKETKTSGNE
ncbi:MAG: hypothetical protein R3174_06470, partial [Gammaproteobacteria bacterium]|nr:hypothetical protein [Gammaproteobacteria bacterium]